jgi:hypothetical protein
MRRIFRWFLVLALFPVVFFLVALALHPYLSQTGPTDADVAVVEGWIPAGLMPAVKKEIERRGYRKIYTTGTIRPFSYWLKEHDAITVELPEPMEGGVRIVAAGLPGARLLVIADEDTVMVRQVTGDIATYWAHPARPVRTLLLRPFQSSAPGDAVVIYLHDLAVGGQDVHEFLRSIKIELGDGRIENGRPTFAHHAAYLLQELGIAPERITPVPADAAIGQRTAGNAQAFAIKARADGVKAFDVISMGVHARRSRNVFQRACGDDVVVGVISLPDPQAPPDRWWRKRIGWIRLLKELVGLPVAGLAGG